MEHFRGKANQSDDLGLDIKGVTRDAMGILERDDWPGNVRELEAVVKRAMVRRRVGWVTPDIVLPRLRRDRLPVAMRALGITLTPAQEQALRLASSRGEVRREIWRCGVGSRGRRRGGRCSAWSALGWSGESGAAARRDTFWSRRRHEEQWP